MGFFDSQSLPTTKGKESFFGSYNVPTNVPTKEPKKSTLSKVGGVVKTVAKDLYSTAATIPVRAVQAEELLRTSFFGSPDSKNKAMEFASQPVDIGFGTQVKPLDTSSVGRAAQQTAGDILKTASLTNIGGKLTLAKQAALQGGAYGLGSGMSEGKSATDIAKDTAIGTVGGLVVGKGLSILGGAKTANKIAKKAEEQAQEASSPRLALPAPKPSSEIPIELPEKGILASQAKLREGQVPTVIPTTSKVKRTTKDTRAEPAVTPVSPEVRAAAEETFRASTPLDTVVPGTEKGWIDAASSKGIQNARDVIAGRASPDPGIPLNAYSSVVKNFFDDTVDQAIIDEMRLAQVPRNAASLGAQEMRATQITGRDNIFDVLYKIETDRYSQLSKNMQRLVDQEGTNASRKILEDVRNFKATNDIIDEITNILTCK